MPALQNSEKQHYPSGEIVFAKLKGYPWWPAKIMDESNVPKAVLEAKRKRKTATGAYVVFFFGSLDYAFFSEKMLRPFNRETVQQDLKTAKIKNKDLVDALHQALDPAALDFLQYQDRDHGSGTSQRRQLEHTKANATSSSRASSSTKRKNTTTTTTTTTIHRNAPKSTKKRTRESGNHNHNKTSYGNDRSIKLQKPLPTETTPIPATTNTKSHTSKYIQLAAKKSPEYERIFKRIFGNRHKLQKLIYNKKPGQVPASDHPKISDILKDIEQCDMTKELLKDTKIGKVVEIGCKYVFENDNSFRLQKRCMDIMQHWKASLLNQNVTPTALNTSSTTLPAPQQDINEPLSPIGEATNKDILLATPTSPKAGKMIPTTPHINDNNNNAIIENSKLLKEKLDNNSNTDKTTKIELVTANNSRGDVLGNMDPSSTASPTTMTDNLIPLPQVFNMENNGVYQQARRYHQVSTHD